MKFYIHTVINSDLALSEKISYTQNRSIVDDHYVLDVHLDNKYIVTISKRQRDAYIRINKVWHTECYKCQHLSKTVDICHINCMNNWLVNLSKQYGYQPFMADKLINVLLRISRAHGR